MRRGLPLAILAAAWCAAPAHAAQVTRPLSDAAAAKRVVRSTFEPRPSNRAATHRMPSAAALRRWRATSSMPYAARVTGHFTGTTDEVIQWAARKWGFAPDLL